jgi:hypothetical protein
MPYHNSRPRTPEVCPVCGESVPRNALACPECGADHRSGWSETADADGLDLPDDDFDYDAFVKEEFGGGGARSRLHPVWIVTAIVLLGAMAAAWLLGAW